MNHKSRAPIYSHKLNSLLLSVIGMAVIGLLTPYAYSQQSDSNVTTVPEHDVAVADEDEPEPVSEAELQQMLAPIALYPDTVLAHILIAASYPLEVVQAQRWVDSNPDLEGDEALAAVENEDWDPSVKALVPFSQLLSNMNDDLDWTQSLGEAFLADETRVMDAIQNLRQLAYDEGNLESLEHLDVTHEEETIIIEPAVREVVYIPYYDSRYVYGNWLWYDYPPTYWHYSGFPYARHHVGIHHGFYWGPRVYVSSGFFFSSFQWRRHQLVVLDHHHHYRRHSVHFGHQIARHHNAKHWRHSARHRRGVVYRNPRTRDYFQKRKAINSRIERRGANTQKVLGRTPVRTAAASRQRSENQRQTFSNRLRGSRGQNNRRADLQKEDTQKGTVRNRGIQKGNSSKSKQLTVKATERTAKNSNRVKRERPSTERVSKIQGKSESRRAVRSSQKKENIRASRSTFNPKAKVATSNSRKNMESGRVLSNAGNPRASNTRESNAGRSEKLSKKSSSRSSRASVTNREKKASSREVSKSSRRTVRESTPRVRSNRQSSSSSSKKSSSKSSSRRKSAERRSSRY